ncbi:MAG TPA: SGNH/GDSL hydrolase family protein [Solirubrobacteraceae bacterium]|nr:SGNH/GDSL hydrolase family protein [Solirubrobacteraceae bacterium]
MACRRPLLVVICTLLATVAGSGTAHAADPGPYVALGDSFTAGPFILTPVGQPVGCGRSDHNYPNIVRGATGVAQFRDASCSSARTTHMTAPQPVNLGTNSPQFDALDAGARLVTVGIGGNDVELVDAALKCLQLGLLAPTGTACRSHFAYPGGDALADKIVTAAPKIAATLQGIHARSPLARVLIVGYPAVAPDNGKGCYPLVPLSNDDITYLDTMLRRTNAMIAEQAAANDAEFVDTYDESVGHDVCTLPGTRWFEGLVPTAPAFPVHPNALGEASMARSVLRVLGQPRPAPALGALRRSARVIRAGRALRVAFTVSRAVNVSLGIQRSRGRGRYTALRPLTSVGAKAGENAVTLTGKLLGRRVGLYRVTATVAAGATQTAQFRIRRAR